MITFTTICGVPLAYDRITRADYGTRGEPLKKGGPVTPEFFAALEAWMDRLRALPWGKPELLVTGGIRGHKPKPGEVSRHWQGRAIDIDAIYWAGKPPLIALRAEKTPRVYLAVEATLRAHFGTVLDYWYNDAHKDHFHVDDGRPLRSGEPATHAYIVFLQAALNFVWDTRPLLKIDGVVGPKTEAAIKAVEAVLPPHHDVWEGWFAFLEATASRGFELATP